MGDGKGVGELERWTPKTGYQDEKEQRRDSGEGRKRDLGKWRWKGRRKRN